MSSNNLQQAKRISGEATVQSFQFLSLGIQTDKLMEETFSYAKRKTQYSKDGNNAADSYILGYMPSSLGFSLSEKFSPLNIQGQSWSGLSCTPAPVLIGCYMNYLTVFHLEALSVRWGLYS